MNVSDGIFNRPMMKTVAMIFLCLCGVWESAYAQLEQGTAKDVKWGRIQLRSENQSAVLSVSLNAVTDADRSADEPYVVFVAVPFAGDAELRVRGVHTLEMSNDLHVRSGFKQATDSSALAPLFTTLAAAGVDIPIEAVELKGYHWYRGISIAEIHIYPFVRQNQGYRAVTSCELELRPQPGSAGHANIGVHGGLGIVDDFVLNYENGVSVAPSNFGMSDTTGGWIDYGLVYLKIAVATDGIYRLHGNALAPWIPSLGSIDASMFHLYNKGKEVPIRIEDGGDGILSGGEFIEFVGSRNYGNPNYRMAPTGVQENPLFLDRYSDTSFYWLTWSGMSGKRVDSLNLSGSTGDTLRWFTEAVHIEQDASLQFVGTDLVLHQDPAWLPGDIWSWGFLDVNQSFNAMFVASDIVLGGPPTQIYARYSSWGAQSGISPAHRTSIHLNGSGSLATDSLDAFQHKLTQASASASLLQNGTNTISLQSLPTPSSVNRLIIDWFDVEYPRLLNAPNDSLIFAFKSIGSREMRTIEISGLSTSFVEIYKLAEVPYRILPSSVEGTGPFTIRIIDTVGNGDRYVLAHGSQTGVPRILQSGAMANLRDPQLGADYLLITSKGFSTPAVQYASLIEATYNLSTQVVFVEDVFDEFGYGYPTPESLREFLQATSIHWQSPMPSFVLLAGDGNYDFKNVTAVPDPSKRERNIIPGLGYPVSDPLLAVFGSIPIPQMHVGRIPISSEQEFMEFHNRVTTYVSQANDDWNKRYILFSGGDVNNLNQISSFKAVNSQIADTYIRPAPVGGVSTQFYKTVSPPSDYGPFTSDEVNELIDQGAIAINYIGHSGTQTWDNGIADPGQLQNGRGRYTIILDVGCSTGKFAEPSIKSFSEMFILGQTGSAIAYIGNSALGFVSVAQSLPQEFFKAVLVDSITTIGEAHLLAKIRRANASGGPNSLLNRVMLLTNTLIGDPAVKLAVPFRPNLQIHSSGIQTTTQAPTDDQDDVEISVIYANTGSVVDDTLQLRFHSAYAQTQADSIVMRPIPLFSDTVRMRYAIRDLAGDHALSVFLNENAEIDEIDYVNNQAATQLVVGSTAIRLFSPQYSYETSLRELTFLNPQRSVPGGQVVLEVDTGAGFQNPQRFYAPLSGVQARFDLQALAFEKAFPWRARISGDTRPWLEGVVKFGSQSPYRWHPIDSTVWLAHEFQNARFEAGNGFRLGEQMVHIKATSSGFDEGRFASIEINGINVVGNTFARGHHVAVLDSGDYSLISVRSFDVLESSAQAESLRVFLESLPPGNIVVDAISDEGSSNLSVAVKNAIKALGSTKIDSVGFRDSWAIIGRKGAAPGTVPERYVPRYGGRAIIETVFVFPLTQAKVVSPFIGPAGAWGDVTVASATPPGTSLFVDLVGVQRNGEVDTLLMGVAGPSIPLGSVSAKQYPALRLIARMETDQRGISPTLQDWAIELDQPAELVINEQIAAVSADTVLRGDPFGVFVGAVNAGLTSADSVQLSLRRISGAALENISSFVIPEIQPGASVSSLQSVQTSGLSGLQTFVIQADSQQSVPEIHRSNNIYSFQVFVAEDSVAPLFDITFDGLRVFDNDYVRPEPEIRILIRDNSPLPITDPNSVVLKLNNRRITLGSSPDSLFETLTGAEKAGVTFRPSLAKGEHLLSVQVLDASGNPADTMEYDIRFKVETDLRLLQVYNFPNPFSTETAFTFHLTGLRMPDELTLRVYTTAGRMVYERKLLPGEVNIGFNRIPWDGRDQNGDAVANGVYFYKVSAVQDGKRVEVVEKLARVR